MKLLNFCKYLEIFPRNQEILQKLKHFSKNSSNFPKKLNQNRFKTQGIGGFYHGSPLENRTKKKPVLGGYHGYHCLDSPIA